MNTAVLFSSKSDDHATPQDFFDRLNAEFQFTLDVCASPENAKCAAYLTKQQDALKHEWEWTGVVWCNPPYSEVGEWMKKARHSARDHGTTVVCLVPARVDTQWWFDAFNNATEVYFIKGRLKFGSAKNSAPFPSALIIFRPPVLQQSRPRVGCWDYRRGGLYPDSQVQRQSA